MVFCVGSLSSARFNLPAFSLKMGTCALFQNFKFSYFLVKPALKLEFTGRSLKLEFTGRYSSTPNGALKAPYCTRTP